MVGMEQVFKQMRKSHTHTLGYTPKGEDEMRLNESSHVAIMYAT